MDSLRGKVGNLVSTFPLSGTRGEIVGADLVKKRLVADAQSLGSRVAIPAGLAKDIENQPSLRLTRRAARELYEGQKPFGGRHCRRRIGGRGTQRHQRGLGPE